MQTASSEDAEGRASLAAWYIASIYVAGFFSLSTLVMLSLATALYCVKLGINPAVTGIILGARSFLPLFLSIQGGVILDRVGVRRILIGLTAANLLLPLVYPATPYVAALVILELVSGLTSSLTWIGSQTALANVAKGHPGHAAIFSFSANMGNLIGPFLVGLAWEYGRVWAGFGVISAWCACLLATLILMPALPRPTRSVALHLRDLLPDLHSHIGALRMLKDAAVATTMFATFIRIATYTIQVSFYAIALVHVGQDESSVGILVGVAGLTSGFATLLSRGARRRESIQPWIMVGSTALAIVAMTVTPALKGFVPLLIAAIVYGIGMGVSMPMLLSSLSAAIPPEAQGMSVGLRTTVNRLAGLLVPVALGGVIRAFGIEVGFFIMGGFLCSLLVLWAIYQTWRRTSMA